MAVDVPSRIWHGERMDPNSAERERLAALFEAAANDRYETKIEAYSAAKINSTTWTRLTTGLSVKPHIMRRAVRHFWPDMGGDWLRVLQASAVQELTTPPTVEQETDKPTG